MTDNLRLCNLCRSAISIADEKRRYAHHASVQDLYGSVQAGCPLCTMLWDSFSNHKHPLDLKSGSGRGHTSFTVDIMTSKGEGSWLSGFLPRFPLYHFKRVREGSPPGVGFEDIVNVFALRVESKFIH